MKTELFKHAPSLLTAAAMAVTLPLSVQQIIGTPGSPSATEVIKETKSRRRCCR